ncbi:hypothetical protein [Flagellimonas allohymeniacidonis]|nr:hypothetical protein [Allomuricauda hymeniacidonis]
MPIPSTGITVEFNFSTSQTFDFAVEEASKFASYRMIGEGKKAVYRVNVPDTSIEELMPLLENLKGWRNRRVYHNGEKMKWDTIFGYQWCYEQRSASFRPNLYCFGYDNDYSYNLWGCIQSRLEFRENSDLFTYGKWLNTKGDWEFDKKRILHELQKNLFPFRFCPALNLGLTREVLEAFPEKVNPHQDKDWKFVENWRSQDGLKITQSKYGFPQEMYANGAQPASMKKFVMGISKKIKHKLPEGV